MKELINYLKDAKHITDIWLNEDGGWMTHEHPDYPHQTTREAVLKMVNEKSPAPTAKPATPAPAKTTTDKPATPAPAKPETDTPPAKPETDATPASDKKEGDETGDGKEEDKK